MKRVLVAVLVFVVLPALAQQVWEKKPVDQWNKKETEKVLRDSPWAKQCLVAYHPLFSRESFDQAGRVRVGTPGGDLSDPERSPDTKAVLAPDLNFVIRWASSKTIAAALDRHATLAGVFRPSTLRQEHPQGDYYRIEVVGDPLNPLPPVDERSLRSSAYLKVGSGDRKAAPEHVRVRREAGYARPLSFDFYFARRTDDGRELIAEDETEVEFVAPVGPRSFRAKFNPSKMKTREGLDF